MSAHATWTNREGSSSRHRAAGLLRAVPDRLVEGGSLRLPPAEPDQGRRWLRGPHLTLLSPSSDGSDGLPQACPADALQLRWSTDGPDRTPLLHFPHQPLPRQPDCWVLTVPLEPLLLHASQRGTLSELVIDGPAPLQLGSGPHPLSSLSTELVACAEQGHSGQWLRLEEQVLEHLSQCLQRAVTPGGPRCDRGWIHLTVSLSWMNGHLAQDFVLPDVAAVAGVTPRALQMAYRKHLRKRPLQCLRLLRLAALRRQLLGTPSASHRLLDHLEHCGLSPSGNTARHYRERYGEKPSQTRR